MCAPIVFTSADGGHACWTEGSQAGAVGDVAVVPMIMATVLQVTFCPLRQRWWCLRGEERRGSRERDVRSALCSFPLSSSLSAALFSGFNQFGQSFGSRPLTSPDDRDNT